MTDYDSLFRRSPEFSGWLRVPAAELFIRQLAERRDTALSALIGACANSSDPRVTKNHATYAELESLTKFLTKSRKESSDDE